MKTTRRGLFGWMAGAVAAGVAVTRAKAKADVPKPLALPDFEHPVGAIEMFAGETPPEGWRWCDGATLRIADYRDLYDVIGKTYGGRDGYFNLPDLRPDPRYTSGAGAHTHSINRPVANTGAGPHNHSFAAPMPVHWNQRGTGSAHTHIPPVRMVHHAIKVR